MDEPKERLADMQGTQETRHRDSFRVQAVIPENTKQDTSGTYQHIVLVSPPTSNPRDPPLLWKCGAGSIQGTNHGWSEGDGHTLDCRLCVRLDCVVTYQLQESARPHVPAPRCLPASLLDSA
jgi:hypothetical protein